ncbi:uncharacterized protein LOC143034481 isoform X2 [Oratosquilla oratoria]|uniref:uncharacterized protein LOC143034481 isoform X2 n=1 Tax=Oratosquilla oratoria TaxID=337810 RepID=UPI003F76D905
MMPNDVDDSFTELIQLENEVQQAVTETQNLTQSHQGVCSQGTSPGVKCTIEREHKFATPPPPSLVWEVYGSSGRINTEKRSSFLSTKNGKVD